MTHEMWQQADGTTMVCLAGPDGEGARALLGPDARLVWIFEAGSYFEAMSLYYARMGWGEYTTAHDWDRQPYASDWVNRQQATASSWRRFHANSFS